MKRAITKAETEKTIRLRVTSSTNENKNLNEMKTKNNVQKAILRWAAVVVSFVLVSYTVSAQDFWKRLLENSSFNEIALALVDSKDNNEIIAEPTESLKAMYFENEVEPNLELENWMTDYSIFDVSEFQLIEETDAELELEAWMMNENLFQPENEVEPLLETEAWMTSAEVWEI